MLFCVVELVEVKYFVNILEGSKAVADFFLARWRGQEFSAAGPSTRVGGFIFILMD